MLISFCCHFRVVYLFSWDPYKDVTYSAHRDSQYCFLPHWYVEEMTRSEDSQYEPKA